MEGALTNEECQQLLEKISALEKENKRLKEELVNKNDDLYIDLFEEAIDGIVFWRENGEVVKANKSSAKIFECSQNELCGKRLFDFVYEKNEKFHTIFSELNRTGAIRDELLFLMPNGQKKLLEFTAKINRNGFNIMILRNVTERFKMEKKLRESEQKFRKIFDGSFDGIILWDENFKIVDVNQTGVKMLGLSKEEIIGQSLTTLLSKYNVKKENLEEYMKKLEKDGQITGTLSTKMNDTKQKYFEFSAKSNLISGLNLSVFRDITEKLEMEEQLRKSDTLHVIGELAAGIAHEIRNPMTALKGFIQLLQGSIKEDHSMYFHVISTELQRMDSIINEFLILAKPQAVKFVECNVVKIMRETVELLNAQAVLHDVQFKTYYEKDLQLLYCEPNQLKKVFINIIKNAIEVMPNGGIITVSVKKTNDNKIHISVEDEGPGMSEEKIKKLGEPFFTTKERGTGLGLMVSYKIVEEHNGVIDVQSKEGIGTTFHIYLPIHKDSEGKSL
ncbi:signal transduction histidine kinase, nitrogen specific, NtrB [Bacillus methanolicus PB1]|uniref:histidine kinase n=1 Tax=Bacillus methanolicus PB1 TaxID=997296 RepID=I3E5E7_BACMT|nr:ATP-binding protein [Bacillus methanolicus]EIJ81718.1 signal transduction histidine kinase, nitrogen specific, NtrB [Bacillus methanolicus PB1]